MPGADIAHVVREACMAVLKENRGAVGLVSQRHLLKAVADTVRHAITPHTLLSGNLND
jgi:SpoVK/Ycf46/Vps4 family AAA+-type ATPase